MCNMWKQDKVIAHIDADAFFASVEQALHPELKGRPVITGAERGIVAAASYEAKASGIKRGMILSEVARLCPECVMLVSDYETYSIFSKRMFSIIRRFTPAVEEYSIDEAFADLTGTARLHRASYSDIGAMIQKEVQRELGIGVSVGISLSKSTAKLCSKIKKPLGLVTIRQEQLHLLLGRTALEDVWGFGPATCALLEKHGLKTALDFTRRPVEFAVRLLGKTGRELWLELKGVYVYEVNPDAKQTQYSISKFKTFTPPVISRDIVYARAVRNLENACIKARRLGQSAGKVALFLRGQDFKTYGLEAKLARSSSSPMDITPELSKLFSSIYRPKNLYRATGIVLSGMKDSGSMQFDLFEDPLCAINREKAFEAVDEADKKFGKHTIFLASGIRIPAQHTGARSRVPSRHAAAIIGETKRRHIGLPMFY